MKKYIAAIILMLFHFNSFADAKVPPKILYKDYQTFRNQDWFQYYLEGLFDGVVVASALAKELSQGFPICIPENFSTSYRKALSIIDEYVKVNEVEPSKSMIFVMFVATSNKYPCK
jgi:hypothetical protein